MVVDLAVGQAQAVQADYREGKIAYAVTLLSVLA